MKGLKKYLQISKVIEDRVNGGVHIKCSEGIQRELQIPNFMNCTNYGVNVIDRDNRDFRIPNFLSNQKVVKEVDDIPMTIGYANVLRDRIKAMTTGEKIVVAEALPVDICIDRIKTEYEKNQKFVNSIKKSFSILGIDE